MKQLAKSSCRVGLFRAPVFVFVFVGPLVAPAQKPKLPRPRILEHEIPFSRDSSTGELQAYPSGESKAASLIAAPVIRSRVALVEIQCTVTAPDGTRVRGLTQDDFRVWDDGVEQRVASFDAATTPASIALVIDASPSIYRELGSMRSVAQSLANSLESEDQAAVVAFAGETHLLLPFSRDRNLLQAALTSPELAQVANSSQSFIYQAVYLSAVRISESAPVGHCPLPWYNAPDQNAQSEISLCDACAALFHVRRYFLRRLPQSFLSRSETWIFEWCTVTFSAGINYVRFNEGS